MVFPNQYSKYIVMMLFQIRISKYHGISKSVIEIRWYFEIRK
jgi:hypothetical protein